MNNFINFIEYKEIKNNLKKFENINIFMDVNKFDEITIKISWAAIGSVDVKDAKNFLNELKNAIDYVEDLTKKYNNIIVKIGGIYEL